MSEPKYKKKANDLNTSKIVKLEITHSTMSSTQAPRLNINEMAGHDGCEWVEGGGWWVEGDGWKVVGGWWCVMGIQYKL